MSHMNVTFTRDMTLSHLKRLVHVQPSDLAGSAAPLCLNTESYEEGISCIAIPVQCAAYAAPRHGSVWGPGGEFKVQSPAGLCMCLFIYIYICIHINLYTYIFIYMNMYINVYIYIHIYICIHIYTYIYINLYTHMCVCAYAYI